MEPHANLINRFYDVPDGKIRYDGININKIKKDDLRRSLAMVLQDTHLFTGTVRENIRYGNLNATDEQIEEAAKLANAHSFIMLMPDGYDTIINADGSNLSQGQRQLLAIARAAVADPPRQEYGSGLPCPPPGALPHRGIKPASPELEADFLPLVPPGKPELRILFIYFY